MLEDLLAGGLLKGRIDEMMDVNLAGKVFQSHGLGHFMGLDVHDVGGYLDGHPQRPEGHGLRSLRTARLMKVTFAQFVIERIVITNIFQANMVITVEPGCYFNDYLIDEALADPTLSKFIVKDRIDEFRYYQIRSGI